MSAYMLHKGHIDSMLTTAQCGPADAERGPWQNPLDAVIAKARQDTDFVGQMLTAEMVKSVSYRYPEDAERDDLPGPIEHWYRQPYIYQQGSRLTLGGFAKAIACYEWQSCQHLGWEYSQARVWCEEMKDRTTRSHGSGSSGKCALSASGREIGACIQLRPRGRRTFVVGGWGIFV